mmetsp:Transcript_32445/g.49644  ORF Transcript_32445/g.49644 Transcript_32445/m.49644 type:complete len:111 (+) Transcript_32445:138-470(+)
MSVFDCFEQMNKTLSIFKVSFIGFLPMALGLVAMMVCVGYFIRYFISDNYRNRKNLMMGCFLMMVANLLTYISIIFLAIFSSQVPMSAIFSSILTFALPIFIWFYFRMIC